MACTSAVLSSSGFSEYSKKFYCISQIEKSPVWNNLSEENEWNMKISVGTVNIYKSA